MKYKYNPKKDNIKRQIRLAKNSKNNMSSRTNLTNAAKNKNSKNNKGAAKTSARINSKDNISAASSSCAKIKNSKQTSELKETLVYIFLGFAIAYILNVGLGLALATDTPVVAIFSESMVPTFQKGDMIFVQGTEGGITGFLTGANENFELEEGDIIVFDAPFYKYPIIHRIKEIEDGKIKTKGDNNAVSDPWETTKEKVHGKAVLRIPYLGWVKVGVFQALNLA